MKTLRVRVEYDEIGATNQDSPTGGPLPESLENYLENPVHRLIDPKADPVKGERRRISYEEYCEYEGNPDRHVILTFSIEEKCPTCREWHRTEHSLSDVDFMDDNEYPSPDAVYTEEQITAWAESYGRQVALELLQEARAHD